MSQISGRCIFIGLPNSGKSSFIGALWHVVDSGELNALYSMHVQPEDREYLNSLRASFLGCVSVERTKTEFIKEIDLAVTENSTGRTIKFTFPDLSGETFESQFEYRKLSKHYLDQVSQCDCVMLFVNPDFLKKPELIAHANEILDFGDPVGEYGLQRAQGNVVGTGENSEWTPKQCQSQVILVDLLQMIRGSLPVPCKIIVVVSAWDLIKKLPTPYCDVNPKEWLAEHLPMLYQYLFCNEADFPFVVYGISAQGGAYSENPELNFPLQSKLKQSERIIVQSDDVTHNDITTPLKWIFE